MASPLTLSVDELRAAARLAGVPVPSVVADDDPDDPRVDLAALRGLACRDLVVGLDEADPEPAGDLARLVAVLDEPDSVVDVELDGGRRWSRAHNGSETVALAVLPGGCVAVDWHPNSVLAALSPLCVAERCQNGSFLVPAEAHVTADALVLDGRGDDAIATLVAAAVPPDIARRWVEAVVTRRGAAAVRVARRRAGEAVEVRELRWLVGGDGQAWRVEDGPDDTSHVRAVGGDELQAGLAELTGRAWSVGPTSSEGVAGR